MNRLFTALAVIVISTPGLAGTIAKDGGYAFGATVDIPPFVSGCLSVQSGSVRVGQSSPTQPVAVGLTQSALISIFGENTCSGLFFFSSGITNNLTFIKSPTGDVLTGSGTIPVFTIGWGN